MKTNDLLKKVGIASAICGLLVTAANATIVYSTTTSAGNFSGSPYILGLDFTVNTVGLVNKIGVFDSGGDGFGASGVSVAIYRVSDGSLVSGTLTSLVGTAGTFDAASNSRFVTLANPVMLTVGTTYSVVVQGLTSAGNSAYYYPYGAPPVKTSFDTVGGMLTLSSTARWTLGYAMTFPNISVPGASGGTLPAFGAGTFDFTPVPEASEFAMAGMGLLAVIYIGRCAVLRRKIMAA